MFRQENALKAPVGAIFRDGDGWAVFTVEDKRARKRALKVPRRNGVEAMIEGGLQPGERLVVYPSDALKDGARALWSRGDYRKIAAVLLPASQRLVDACAISAAFRAASAFFARRQTLTSTSAINASGASPVLTGVPFHIAGTLPQGGTVVVAVRSPRSACATTSPWRCGTCGPGWAAPAQC